MQRKTFFNIRIRLLYALVNYRAHPSLGYKEAWIFLVFFFPIKKVEENMNLIHYINLIDLFVDRNSPCIRARTKNNMTNHNGRTIQRITTGDEAVKCEKLLAFEKVFVKFGDPFSN